MPPLNLELTTEQLFQIRLMQDSAPQLSKEQAIELLLEATRQLMIKDNVIKGLLKGAIPQEFPGVAARE